MHAGVFDRPSRGWLGPRWYKARLEMNVEKVMTSGRNKNIVSSSAVALRLDAKQPITSIDPKKEYSYVCIYLTYRMYA